MLILAIRGNRRLPLLFQLFKLFREPHLSIHLSIIFILIRPLEQRLDQTFEIRMHFRSWVGCSNLVKVVDVDVTVVSTERGVDDMVRECE